MIFLSLLAGLAPPSLLLEGLLLVHSLMMALLSIQLVPAALFSSASSPDCEVVVDDNDDDDDERLSEEAILLFLLNCDSDFAAAAADDDDDDDDDDTEKRSANVSSSEEALSAAKIFEPLAVFAFRDPRLTTSGPEISPSDGIGANLTLPLLSRRDDDDNDGTAPSPPTRLP